MPTKVTKEGEQGSKTPKKRPLGVIFLATIQVASGAVALIVALGAIAFPLFSEFLKIGKVPLDVLSMEPVIMPLGILTRAFWIFSVFLAFGVLRRHPLAWTLSVGFYIACLIFDVALLVLRTPLFNTPISPYVSNVVGIIICLTILVYLTRPQTKAYFRKL